MKKFLAGVLVSALIFSTVPALATQLQTITASLNSVNIEVRGEQVAAVGEGYTLANGDETAKTIVYNQTTYVPIRYFGELMGEEIGWNQETSSVTIGQAPAPAKTPAAPASDYSNWSAEDEAAYQEFKGMWGEPERNNDVQFQTVLDSGNLDEYALKINKATAYKFAKKYTEAVVEDYQLDECILLFIDRNKSSTNAGKVLVISYYNGKYSLKCDLVWDYFGENPATVRMIEI